MGRKGHIIFLKKEACYVGVVLYHDIISSTSLVLPTVSNPSLNFWLVVFTLSER